MRESKTKSITGVGKLIETVHDVGGLLQPPAKIQASPALQEWLEKTRKIAAQFEFELRTELTRLGGEMPEPGHVPVSSLESGLKLTLEYYQQALSSTLTAHARAMLVRQSEEIRRASEELTALSRAA
jgi:hypothetical protein